MLTIPPGATSPSAVSWPNYGTNTGPANAPIPTGQLLTASPDGSQWHFSTYGTDSGIQMLSGAGFTKWVFQLAGPGANASGSAAFGVSLYGTVDAGILSQVYSNPAQVGGFNPVNAEANLTMIPGYDWFLLPGPSEQSGTGTMANPMVTSSTGGTMLYVSMPLIAVRAVLTTAPTTGTAPLRVLGFAVP
jgi:hypothetical protein